MLSDARTPSLNLFWNAKNCPKSLSLIWRSFFTQGHGKSMNNKYLLVLAAILAVMVIDQGVSLYRISDFSKLQERIINDQWDLVKNCKKEMK
jgi:hypothetical protein